MSTSYSISGPSHLVEPSLNEFGILSLEDSSPSSSSSSSSKQKMLVSRIHFTQNTVSTNFTDGTSVADLTHKLANGQISPDDIPPIRVVQHQSQFWTLDNRRLRAFKDSLTSEIPIIRVDLKDSNIKQEFWNKKTNKSAIDGGAVRSPARLDKQQFEEGVYVFNKRILNWTFEFIEQPMPAYQRIPIEDTYNDRHKYYRSFENLIFEEARAILQIGLQEAKLQEKYSFQLALINIKTAKTAENPTEMKFAILPNSQNDVKSCDTFLLEPVDNPNFRVIAIANYSPLDPIRPELSFKVVIDYMGRLSYAEKLQPHQLWKGVKLGSLITLQRMFDACSSAQQVIFPYLERCILSGQFIFSHLKKEINEAEKELLTILNPSQREAVEKFLQLKAGLDLIQGPPGTGKTTTIIQLLGVLQIRQERILVSAPSNKAVHVLAERFMYKFPDVPILLVGVEEKLPYDSPLNSIFMDLWSIERIKNLEDLSKLLWDFQPQKLLEGNLKFIENRIKRKCGELLQIQSDFDSFVNDLNKYNLPSLKDIGLIHREFKQSVTDYCLHINSHDLQDWEEAELYFRKINESVHSPKMPEWLGLTRSCISKIAIILSSLQVKLRNISEEELLNYSQLVFATLSVSGQQRFKNVQAFDTLIVDEAGQAVEAETLIPIIKMNPKKCLLIGDIQQLPATVISQDAEKLRFGRSLMERLIECCNQPSSMLKVQYRMRPEISSWPSQKYYQSQLENDLSVSHPEYALNEVGSEMPFLAPYSFIHIDGKEVRGPSGRSFFNVAEVESTARILHYLAQKCLIDVETRVSIISFYGLQVEHIRSALTIKYPKIKVNTVDGFQGGESDIVIISCVRANYEKQIGFLKASKRLNVALTRAKFSLIILGNQPTLARSDIAELVTDAEKRNVFFTQKVIQDLEQNFQSLVTKPKKIASKTTHRKGLRADQKRMVTLKSQSSSDRKSQVCFEFARSSFCRFGDRCRFQHNVPSS